LFKNILAFILVLLLVSTQAYASTSNPVEVFDIQKERVIKSIASDYIIQREVSQYLQAINRSVGKLKPIPLKGTMIKFFLTPPVFVNNKILHTTINEVILIIPEAANPYLMIFDEKQHLLFYYFEGNTEILLKYLYAKSNRSLSL
jgi:hypothetical protein